jgi:hypothetical protein
MRLIGRNASLVRHAYVTGTTKFLTDIYIYTRRGLAVVSSAYVVVVTYRCGHVHVHADPMLDVAIISTAHVSIVAVFVSSTLCCADVRVMTTMVRSRTTVLGTRISVVAFVVIVARTRVRPPTVSVDTRLLSAMIPVVRTVIICSTRYERLDDG